MLGAYLINGTPCELLIEQDTLSWWQRKTPPTFQTQTSSIGSADTQASSNQQNLPNESGQDDDHEETAARKKRLIEFDQIVGLRRVQSRGSIRRTNKEKKMKQPSDSSKIRSTNSDETQDSTTTNDHDKCDGSERVQEQQQQQFDKLKVYYAKRNEKKSTGRLLKLKKLTIEVLPRSCTGVSSRVISQQNQEQKQRLLQDVNDLIEQHLELKRRQRPRRLLIFVNPYGGKGKALQLYKSRVRKLLDLAQVECELQVTRYANHARDTVEDPLFNLDLFDGIVCIGGDGMFAELMNGLLFRFNRDKLISNELDLLNRRLSESLTSTTTNQSLESPTPMSDPNGQGQSSMQTKSDCGSNKHLAQQLRFLRSSLGGIGEQFQSPNIPIGVIGAGSTDANLFGFIGTNDAFSATLNIILGNQIQIDVCSIHSVRDDRLLRFVSTFVAYGYFGDVIRESEKLRWLGPSRYDITALNSLIKYRNYQGLVRILRSRADGSPLDLMNRCHLNCRLCCQQSANVCNNDDNNKNKSAPNNNSSSSSNNNNNNNSSSNNHISSSLSCDESLLMRACGDDATTTTTTTSEKPIAQAGRPRTPSDDADLFELVEVEGSFVGVNAAVTACRCPQTRKGFSPGNHLANGCADLILVRPCSRMQYINYLIRTGYTRKSAFDLKYVDAYRCRQFEFIVQSDGSSTKQRRQQQSHVSDDIATSDYQSKDSTKLSTNSTSIASSRQSSHANSLDSKQYDSAASSYQAEAPLTAAGHDKSHQQVQLSRSNNSTSKYTYAVADSHQHPRQSDLDNDDEEAADAEELDIFSSWNADGEILREQSIRVKVNNKLLRVFGTGEPQPRPSKGRHHHHHKTSSVKLNMKKS